MVTDIDTLLNPLIDRTAFLHDGQYHADVCLLRASLIEVSISLTKTGVDDTTRTTILEALIKGLPSAADAHQRRADRDKKIQELMKQPPRPIFVNVGPVGCHGCGNPYTYQAGDGTCSGCADS